jgi:single-stranded DNA-specific DHH superfamily exonuclease
VELFIERCINENQIILEELKIRSANEKEKENKMMKKMIELEFGLAWDDKYKWLDRIILPSL